MMKFEKRLFSLQTFFFEKVYYTCTLYIVQVAMLPGNMYNVHCTLYR